MSGILLRVRKKTLVPTKHALVHQYRSDWKTAAVISPEQSKQFFHHYNSRSEIKTDAHFAYWIYSNFGAGIYSTLAFMKGRKGFWNFMKIECTDAGFMRLQKNQTAIEKEKLELAAEYRKLKKTSEKIGDDEEKNFLKDEMESIKDELELSEEIIELEKSSRSGCYPYLKSLQPVYKFHEYRANDDDVVIPELKTTAEEYKLW